MRKLLECDDIKEMYNEKLDVRRLVKYLFVMPCNTLPIDVRLLMNRIFRSAC